MLLYSQLRGWTAAMWHLGKLKSLINWCFLKKKHYNIYFDGLLDIVFRTLIEGTELLKKLENLPTFNERPKVDCRVMACGKFEPGA